MWKYVLNNFTRKQQKIEGILVNISKFDKNIQNTEEIRQWQGDGN